jgi:cbb3-type cytochrome oxidase maturation protein
MSIIYILIPVAILLTALGIYLFFWAVKTDQFDDLEKQGMSILFDQDDLISKEKHKNDEKTSNETNNLQVNIDPIENRITSDVETNEH